MRTRQASEAEPPLQTPAPPRSAVAPPQMRTRQASEAEPPLQTPAPPRSAVVRRRMRTRQASEAEPPLQTPAPPRSACARPQMRTRQASEAEPPLQTPAPPRSAVTRRRMRTRQASEAEPPLQTPAPNRSAGALQCGRTREELAEYSAATSLEEQLAAPYQEDVKSAAGAARSWNQTHHRAAAYDAEARSHRVGPPPRSAVALRPMRTRQASEAEPPLQTPAPPRSAGALQCGRRREERAEYSAATSLEEQLAAPYQEDVKSAAGAARSWNQTHHRAAAYDAEARSHRVGPPPRSAGVRHPMRTRPASEGECG
ncbi:hypothetical protein LdCL_190023200 [Leishmania donovani]|uniref:Uncharacterized protein n=1 Tax=Leishmania donovani TaxID=5661 RepID=A0A3S5H777_LEIDO|nr:hypothetical protein LdCL_190023200 [Leishmania donovani]